MSENPLSIGQAADSHAGGIFEHWCEHPGCTAWGSYGYQARRSDPQHFFCYDHREVGERILG